LVTAASRLTARAQDAHAIGRLEASVPHRLEADAQCTT